MPSEGFKVNPDGTFPGTKNSPLPPSVEAAYYKKCIELKRRINEVEESNDAARIRKIRINRQILKMRLERAFLLEQLQKRMEYSVEESDDSTEPPPTPQDRPLRSKRAHRKTTPPPPGQGAPPALTPSSAAPGAATSRPPHAGEGGYFDIASVSTSQSAAAHITTPGGFGAHAPPNAPQQSASALPPILPANAMTPSANISPAPPAAALPANTNGQSQPQHRPARDPDAMDEDQPGPGADRHQYIDANPSQWPRDGHGAVVPNGDSAGPRASLPTGHGNALPAEISSSELGGRDVDSDRNPERPADIADTRTASGGEQPAAGAGGGFTAVNR